MRWCPGQESTIQAETSIFPEESNEPEPRVPHRVPRILGRAWRLICYGFTPQEITESEEAQYEAWRDNQW